MDIIYAHHSSRYQLAVFLKGGGLGLEYLCTHYLYDWEKDGKQIRVSRVVDEYT